MSTRHCPAVYSSLSQTVSPLFSWSSILVHVCLVEAVTVPWTHPTSWLVNGGSFPPTSFWHLYLILTLGLSEDGLICPVFTQVDFAV